MGSLAGGMGLGGEWYLDGWCNLLLYWWGEGRKGRKKRVGIGMISGPDGIWLIKCSTR